MEPSANNQGQTVPNPHTLDDTLIWQLHLHFHGRWALEGNSISLTVGFVGHSRGPAESHLLELEENMKAQRPLLYSRLSNLELQSSE